MMDENNIFSKQNTIPNVNGISTSDDSYSGASFPWFPQTKRKSQLGKLRNRTKENARILQDVVPNIQADSHKDFRPHLDFASKLTPISTFQPFLSISPSIKTLKTPIISPESTPISAIKSVFNISPPTNDFKTPNVSQQPAFNTTLESPFSISNSPADRFKAPVIPPHANTNLKSSLKKQVNCTIEEKRPIEDLPQEIIREVTPKKVREATPKKEVRFAEPAPLPKSNPCQKLTKDLPTQIIVKDKRYTIVRELGSGGSSTVYEVSDPNVIESLAIKRVLLPDEDESVAEGYLQEVKMLEKLQGSDAIIKMVDHELINENGIQVLYVVMEKGEIDLSKLMRTINKSEKLHYITFYWGRMLSVVNEIHSREIIHMDLKPANFLLVRGRLKLIDFGIASSMPGDKTSIYKDIFSGTLSYMSPEAISFIQSPGGPSGFRISKKSDVWSLGCILYSWIYGHLPFSSSKNKWNRLKDIADLEKEVDFPEREGIPEAFVNSLKLCLKKDPKKRPTVTELLNMKLEIYFDQVMS